jgi:hypothetical protein
MTSRDLKVLDLKAGIVPIQLRCAWNDSLLHHLPSGRDIELILNTSYGWYGADLSFLETVPRLKSVQIVGTKPIQAISLPYSLESIFIGKPLACCIDFTKLPYLKKVFLDWSKYTDSIQYVGTITDLRMYKFKFPDLSSLYRLTELKSLGLVQSPITSLEGVENFSHLQTLELAYCPKLTTISALAGNLCLEELDCQNCKKVGDWDSLRNLTQLKSVRIENCKEIASLNFLTNHQSLQRLDVTETNVLDGDFGQLLQCKSLVRVLYEKKRHYSHTSDQWHKARFPNAVWTQGF